MSQPRPGAPGSLAMVVVFAFGGTVEVLGAVTGLLVYGVCFVATLAGCGTITALLDLAFAVGGVTLAMAFYVLADPRALRRAGSVVLAAALAAVIADSWFLASFGPLFTRFALLVILPFYLPSMVGGAVALLARP